MTTEQLLLLLLPLLVTFAVSLAVVKLSIEFCRRFEVYDSSGGRKIHTNKVGRLGGVGVIISFSIAFYFFIKSYIPAEISIIPFILAALMIAAMGLADDIKGVKARYKFGIQIIASSLVVYGGISIPFAAVFFPYSHISFYIDSVFTVIWIVAFMNAVNLIDGMDGLSTGIVLIALIFYTAVGIHSNNTLLILLSITLMGGIAGFYVFNFPPAKIFLGDGGAYFTGFMLALLIPFSSPSSMSIKITIVPAVILLLPFLDVGQVITRRLWLKYPIFSPDNNHLHHKFLKAGYSVKESLVAIYVISFIFGTVGVLLWVGGLYTGIYSVIIGFLFSLLIMMKVSSLEDRTRMLSCVSEPGVHWWKQSGRYLSKDVYAVITAINGKTFDGDGKIYDISTHGMYFSTTFKVKQSDIVSINLMFSNRKPLKITAEAIWIGDGSSGEHPAGFGCCFRGLNGVSRRRIKYHLIACEAVLRKRIKERSKRTFSAKVLTGTFNK